MDYKKNLKIELMNMKNKLTMINTSIIFKNSKNEIMSKESEKKILSTISNLQDILEDMK